MKIRPVGAGLLRADGLADRLDEANSLLSQYCKSPKNSRMYINDDEDDAEGAIKGVNRPGLKVTTLLRLVSRYRMCGAVPSFAHMLPRHGFAYVKI